MQGLSFSIVRALPLPQRAATNAFLSPLGWSRYSAFGKQMWITPLYKAMPASASVVDTCVECGSPADREITELNDEALCRDCVIQENQDADRYHAAAGAA
jgi:hypothetical protein